MDVIKNILTLLKIPGDESTTFLLGMVGLSNDEMSLRIITYFSEKILEQYETVKDEVDVVKFSEFSPSLKENPEVMKRIQIYRAISSYDFWRMSSLDLISTLTTMSEQISRYQLTKFIWSVVVGLDIPPCHRRLAATFLFSFDETKVFTMDALKSIITSDANIVEKYYALSALKFLLSNSCIETKFSRVDLISNDYSLLQKHDEHFLQISGQPRPIELQDLDMLRELGNIALTVDRESFEIKTIYRQTREATAGGFTRVQTGFGSTSYSGDSEFDLNQFSYYVSMYKGREYMVKMVENVGDGAQFRSKRYSDSDYACMIGLLCGNGVEILPFYDMFTNTRLISIVGSYLLSKNIDGADITILNLVQNTDISSDVRIAIAHSLKNLENKSYVRTAYRILKDHFFMMTKSQKQKVESLIDE